MESTIVLPIYEPSPYRFSGCAADELPLLARYYLGDVAKILPGMATGQEGIEQKCAELTLALFRSLQGTDIALVEHRQAARKMAPRRHTETIEVWHQRVMASDKCRLNEVVGVLLPERQTLLDEFMVKFDALLWLQMEKSGWSAQEQQDHRDRLVAPILEYTNQALQALDEAVMKRVTETQDVQETSLFMDADAKSPETALPEAANPTRTPRVLLPGSRIASIAEEAVGQGGPTESTSLEHVRRRLRFIRGVHSKVAPRMSSER